MQWDLVWAGIIFLKHQRNKDSVIVIYDMKRAVLTLLFWVSFSLAEASEPDVLTAFFGHNGVSDKQSVYHGEMLQYFSDKPTLGERLPKDVKVQFRSLIKANSNAIYAVLVRDGHSTHDYYVFLVREHDIWKLSAVRSLALPGVFYMALQELKQKAPRTKKEEWQYQNSLLTIKSDIELKAYLKTNIAKFKKVVELLSKGDKEQSEEEAKRLFVNFIEKEGDTYKLMIGGMLDNSVGYLYVPQGAKPPDMNPSEFIYVEEIADGWYIYKTT